MEEVDICAKCGKMIPMTTNRSLFTCPRCGSHSIMTVPLKDYEKVVQKLQENCGLSKEKTRKKKK